VVGVEGHVREPLSPAALPRSSTRAASLGRSVTNPKVPRFVSLYRTGGGREKAKGKLQVLRAASVGGSHSWAPSDRLPSSTDCCIRASGSRTTDPLE